MVDKSFRIAKSGHIQMHGSHLATVDANWYLSIAEYGFGISPGDFHFPPLFIFLIRIVGSLTVISLSQDTHITSGNIACDQIAI